MDIKKIKKKVYGFSLTDDIVKDGYEIFGKNPATDRNEMADLLKHTSLEDNIVVYVSDYGGGLYFHKDDDGMFSIVSDPSNMPSIVSFTLHFNGLKRGAWYKLSVVGRNTNNVNLYTDNRNVTVTNELREMILNAELSKAKTNTTYTEVFNAHDVETELRFKIGKVFIRDIILEEIEVEEPAAQDSDDIVDTEVSDGKITTVAYGVFMPFTDTDRKDFTRYSRILRYSGCGIVLYKDHDTGEYILEKDNRDESFTENLNASNIIIDINTNKCDNGVTASCITCSPEPSPNTRHSGYLRFLLKETTDVVSKESAKASKLFISVQKIN